MTSRQAGTLDAAALVIDFCDGVVLHTAHDAHRAVSRRFFAPVRSVGGRFPEAVHDAVVDTAYSAGSGMLKLTGGALRSLSARGIGGTLEGTAPGRRVVAAVNTLAGSHLQRTADPHAIAMAVRSARTDLPLTRFHLANAFREATSHLVIFVHGLAGTEESWHSGSVDHVQNIARRTSGTPVVLRYNTGLSPSENGRTLDILLASLVDLWPTRPTRVTLIGHQMGGIVARSAVNTAVAHSRSWVSLVRDMIFLGEPQVGSALEKAAAIRGQRSRPAQIRTGHVGPRAWTGEDVTGLWGRDRFGAAPLAGADHWYAVAEPSAAVLASMQVADLVVNWIELRDRAPKAIGS